MVGTHLMYAESIDGQENIFALLAAILGGKSAETSLLEWGLEPVPQPIAERNADMIRMRKAGRTYQEIGDMYGLSKYAVFKACKKHGVSSKQKRRVVL